MRSSFQRSMSYDWTIKIGVLVSIGYFLNVAHWRSGIFSLYFTLLLIYNLVRRSLRIIILNELHIRDANHMLQYVVICIRIVTYLSSRTEIPRCRRTVSPDWTIARNRIYRNTHSHRRITEKPRSYDCSLSEHYSIDSFQYNFQTGTSLSIQIHTAQNNVLASQSFGVC